MSPLWKPLIQRQNASMCFVMPHWFPVKLHIHSWNTNAEPGTGRPKNMSPGIGRTSLYGRYGTYGVAAVCSQPKTMPSAPADATSFFWSAIIASTAHAPGIGGCLWCFA